MISTLETSRTTGERGITSTGVTSTGRLRPAGQPPSVQIREPEPVNILTAMAENVSVVKSKNGTEKSIALAWLFHLDGDIHPILADGTTIDG